MFVLSNITQIIFNLIVLPFLNLLNYRRSKFIHSIELKYASFVKKINLIKTMILVIMFTTKQYKI